jgi:hypothetical protein
MPRRLRDETTYLLGSIEEEEDEENTKERNHNCGGAIQSIGNLVALLVCALLLYLQLLRVQSQLKQQQLEIDHLEDVIQNEQKGEIEHLTKQVQDEHMATLYYLAGTFVLIGGLITMFHMRSHMVSMHEPSVQRKILAILAMCPIYSLTSFLSLVFPGIREYLAIIKDFYEAYVIYQFLSFLIAVLGKGNRSVVVELLSKHANHLKPPLACLNCLYYPDPKESNKAMANAVLLECQIFALQFVFLRPILSIALFVLEMMSSSSGEEQPLPTWNLLSPRFYLVMVQNISVFMAFAGLLRFYHAVHEYIEWIEPFPKFLCIKGVVFMTFWQGLAISIFAGGNNASSSNDGDDDDNDNHVADAAAQIQNLLICLEMLGFSIAHYFVFPTEEWEEGFIRKRIDMSVGDSIAFGDFISDVKMVYKSGQQQSAARRAEQQQQRAERTIKDYSTIDGSTTSSTNTTFTEPPSEFADDAVGHDDHLEAGESHNDDNMQTMRWLT